MDYVIQITSLTPNHEPFHVSRTPPYSSQDEARDAIIARSFDYKENDGWCLQFNLDRTSCQIAKPSEKILMTVEIVSINS